MAVPQTREQFIQYCRRRLGEPVICLNLDDEQIEDRVDDALHYYRDYHFDGTEQIIHKHQVTAADQTNRWIPLDENIIGVQDILPVGSGLNTQNLFNVRYQIHLNDMFNFTAGALTPYVMAMRHIETLEEIFIGRKPVRFNRHTDKLYIDMDWDTDVMINDYIIVLAYRTVDPETHPDVYGDWWLQRYATCLIKRQWGENLKKFEGMQLPGGIQFNGQKIWEEAVEEQNKLEEEMVNTWSLPVGDMQN